MKLGEKRGKEDGAPLKDCRQLSRKRDYLLHPLMMAKKPLELFGTTVSEK